MVERKDVLSFNYYTYGSAFTGSDRGKRYRIIKEEREKAEEGKEPETFKVFQASVWNGPFAYDKTPKEEVFKKDFEFSPEGLEKALNWINEDHSCKKE